MSHTPNAYAGLLGAIHQDAWGPDAACIGKAQTLENADLQDAAKAMCLGDPSRGIPRCPVIEDCYRSIMPLTRHQDPGGVRHGMTEEERNAKRRHFATLQSARQKRCPRCGQFKAAVAFNSNKAKGDGLNSYCRTCDSARRTEQRQMKKAVGQ